MLFTRAPGMTLATSSKNEISDRLPGVSTMLNEPESIKHSPAHTVGDLYVYVNKPTIHNIFEFNRSERSVAYEC